MYPLQYRVSPRVPQMGHRTLWPAQYFGQDFLKTVTRTWRRLFLNRGVGMDTEVFENRGVDIDMDTVWNRFSPNSDTEAQSSTWTV